MAFILRDLNIKLYLRSAFILPKRKRLHWQNDSALIKLINN